MTGQTFADLVDQLAIRREARIEIIDTIGYQVGARYCDVAKGEGLATVFQFLDLAVDALPKFVELGRISQPDYVERMLAINKIVKCEASDDEARKQTDEIFGEAPRDELDLFGVLADV